VSVIALQHVTKTFATPGGQAVTAVRAATLTIERGEFVVITGRSGSGKTTLLNLAAGLTRPSAGEVTLDGTNLWSLPDREQSRLRNDKMGFIFQFPSLLPSLTVLENVLLPTAFGSNHTSGAWSQRGEELLVSLGLGDKRAAYPRQLSAGQQQRVVIARALINRPALLLADEPTSNLDEQTEREILDLLREIHTTTGVTILMVTHSAQLVPYGSRVARMADGTLVEVGAVRPSSP
jgi:putative ABC transport system ATP-binding protein/lipoprotein-releasing system ATP-binding protein